MSTGGRNTPPFRADHVGSLLRPKKLLDARENHAAGRLSFDRSQALEKLEINWYSTRNATHADPPTPSASPAIPAVFFLPPT